MDTTAVDSPETTALLREYFAEMVSRYVGRTATAEEVDAAMAEDPSTALTSSHGRFLLARRDGHPAGCAGVTLVDPGVAEMKRVYVRADHRGLGGGSVLVRAVESVARELGAGVVRLDTRGDLVEARQLYARRGYREIPAYNDGPYAEHWFEKSLGLDPPGAVSP